MSAMKMRQRKGDSRAIESPRLTPSAEVNRFFQEILQRAWTDAEKEIDGIREKSDGGDWSRGYVKALEGLLLTFKGNDDKYAFLPKIVSGPSEGLASMKKEFADFSSNELHGDYDRGFFKGMEDYLGSLSGARQTFLETSQENAKPDSEPSLKPKQDSDEAQC